MSVQIHRVRPRSLGDTQARYRISGLGATVLVQAQPKGPAFDNENAQAVAQLIVDSINGDINLVSQLLEAWGAALANLNRNRRPLPDSLLEFAQQMEQLRRTIQQNPPVKDAEPPLDTGN